MATIRQRNNRWQCIVKRKGYPPLSKTFDLRNDAEKWARLQERLMDAGQWVDRTEAEQTTFGQLLDRYAREITCTKRGAEVETIRINALKRSTLARYAVAAISRQSIANWRDQRLQEVSGSTVTRDLQLLSHVFTIAIREWGFGLTANPVSLVRKPTKGPARDRTLTDQERLALITSCGQCRNPWIKSVVIFALETAARRGEILALRWKDVDLERHIAKLNVTKTGQPRTLPLSPACLTMLRNLPRSVDGRVFPLTMQSLKQAYERSVLRAGIRDFRFHDLRHDSLTRLAKIGLSVLELRAISGHTSTDMLARYVSINAEDLARKIG